MSSQKLKKLLDIPDLTSKLNLDKYSSTNSAIDALKKNEKSAFKIGISYRHQVVIPGTNERIPSRKHYFFNPKKYSSSFSFINKNIKSIEIDEPRFELLLRGKEELNNIENEFIENL